MATETYKAYCLKCKRQRTVEGEYRVTVNGKGMLQGPCSKCGTNTSKITAVRTKKKKAVA